MPVSAPPQEAAYQVFVFGLPEQESGLYPVERLDQLDDGPRLSRKPQMHLSKANTTAELLRRASSAVIAIGAAIDSEAANVIGERYDELISYSRFRVYLLKSSHANGP